MLTSCYVHAPEDGAMSSKRAVEQPHYTILGLFGREHSCYENHSVDKHREYNRHLYLQSTQEEFLNETEELAALSIAQSVFFYSCITHSFNEPVSD